MQHAHPAIGWNLSAALVFMSRRSNQKSSSLGRTAPLPLTLQVSGDSYRARPTRRFVITGFPHIRPAFATRYRETTHARSSGSTRRRRMVSRSFNMHHRPLIV
jgi:hypothetical protein